MVRVRDAHNPKTYEEKREYFKTMIRSPAGPTLEDMGPIIDTTDRLAKIEEKPGGRPKRNPPLKKQINILAPLREHLIELVILAICGAFGWLYIQIYGLNREVGEFKNAPKELEKQITNVEKGLSEKIGVLSSNVNRLEQRMDGLLDRNYKGGLSNKKKE